MPLAEMARAIACCTQGFCKIELLKRKMAGIRKINPVPSRVPACQNGTTSRRADRRSRIKSVQDKPFLSHRIKVRSANRCVAIKSDITPAEVIRHHKDDVGTTRGRHFARFSTLTRRRKKQYEAEGGSQEDACGVKKNAKD